MLLLVCLIPLAALLLYLLVMVEQFSRRYDVIVENITKANAYNINFKEDMDYLMYIIVVNAERAGELVDTEQPHLLIEDARQVFQGLFETADAEYARNRLNGIIKSLNTLEDRVEEIEADALVSGSYDRNMERLDLNIRILTELIQEQIQKYIYYETTNLESLRGGVRADVDGAVRTVSIGYVLILAGALLISRRIMTNITGPIRRLCEMTRQVGKGDFAVQAREGSDDELAVLNSSFNRMVEEVGKLVEDIRIEQLNLRATELKLLQAQINPHFLYNTLDTIIWLAEAGDSEQVVTLVSALSDFFRTTLSKGRDYITVREEEAHIRSYLQIQRLRYRDILEYEIQIPEELYQYQILKLTLQPLVENALYHGIKNKRGMGHIRVTGESLGDRLVFRVWDNGKGMEPEELERVRKLIWGSQAGGDGPSGFGLFNVAQRIFLNYGAEYSLSIDSEAGEWTESVVEIPAVKN
ncbi:MAG: sensor histidine kinase [Lachnospiraceae bacterium]|nr:sensor histidine kinase [Lachnospiraceae bacterium]